MSLNPLAQCLVPAFGSRLIGRHALLVHDGAECWRGLVFAYLKTGPAITKPLELMTLAANLQTAACSSAAPRRRREGRRRFESKSIRSYWAPRYGRPSPRSRLESPIRNPLRAVRRMKGVSIMDIRSLARNAAPVRTLKECEAQIATCKR